MHLACRSDSSARSPRCTDIRPCWCSDRSRWCGGRRHRSQWSQYSRLSNGGQAVRVVVGVRDLRLAHHRHRGSAARIVVGIVDGSLWRHFLGETIQPVIGSRDRGCDGSTSILFLHLRDSVSSVIRVVRARPVLKGRLRSSVQRIVDVTGSLALPVEHRGQVPVVVVSVGFGVEEGIFSGACPVHIVVRVDRLLRFRIRDGQQIAVGIVPQLRDAIDRIGE